MLVNKRVFLDTNVIIDILNSQRVNHKNATKLLEQLILNDISVVISEDMLSTIFYIVKDKKKTLEFFLVVIEDWIVSPYGKETIKKALKISLENSVDLEDTLQCLCAKENGCDALITHDNKFYNCGIEILTIEQFLNNDD
ncbi:MAG: type II toxin-antitoxin system VapC family toxin [Campylobacterota bacterium]|nr:type II toxin-antitoxin system VapC family toxin [Campylobacterota bacterium]